jgi:hypothetical protein
VRAATGTFAAIEELWEAVFSVRAVPRPYNEDQPPLLESIEFRQGSYKSMKLE